MDIEHADLLKAAVDERRRAVLHVPGDAAAGEVQIQFLSESGMEEADGFWVAPITGRAPYAQLIASATPLEVSFATKDAVAMFSTRLLKRRTSFFQTRALLLESPTILKLLQRRKHARERVPGDTSIPVDVALSDSRGQPGVVQGKLADLSLKGAGFMCPAESAADLTRGTPLAIRIHHGDQNLVLCGHVRRVHLVSPADIAVGIEFAAQAAGEQQTVQKLEQFLAYLTRLRMRHHFIHELRRRV